MSVPITYWTETTIVATAWANDNSPITADYWDNASDFWDKLTDTWDITASVISDANPPNTAWSEVL